MNAASRVPVLRYSEEVALFSGEARQPCLSAEMVSPWDLIRLRNTLLGLLTRITATASLLMRYHGGIAQAQT
jgi:hypothetical protein